MKRIYIVLAVFFLFYYILCVVMTRFSFVMFVIFMFIVSLFITLYIVSVRKIDFKKRGPSLKNIFIKTVSVLFFISYISVIIINIYVKKPELPNDKEYDYLIIFGAAISVDNRKNVIINKRIDAGVKYGLIHKKTKFILSGSKGDDEIIEEAYYMRNYMIDKGIEKERILVDIFSYNTYENINNSLFIIKEDLLRRNKQDSIILQPFTDNRNVYNLDYINIGFVSNDFHLLRINLIAKKKGIKNVYDIQVPTTAILYLYYQIREVMSLYKSFILEQF